MGLYRVMAPAYQETTNRFYTPNAPTEQAIASYANQASQLNNDEDKWQAAVDLATAEFQTKEDYSNQDFKEAIDTYYDQFDPEKSAREMRGENTWTDAINGAKNLINGVNTGIGNGIDFVWDSLIGGAFDLAGAHSAADSVRNLMTGEDLAIVPDLATDVALVASGWGIPVMMAKNAVQLSPYMQQAVSGKDETTLEDIDTAARVASGLLGFGGAALSAVPGIGKAANLAKATSKKAAQSGLETAAANATEAFDAVNNLPKALQKNQLLTKAGNPSSAVKKEAETALLEDADKGLIELPKTVNNKGKPSKAGKTKQNKLINERALKLIDEANDTKTKLSEAEKAFADAETFANKSRLERVNQVMNEDLRGLGRGVTGVPAAVREAREAAKGAKVARSAVREANKTAGTKTPIERFDEILDEAVAKAKETNPKATKKEVAKAWGVELTEEGKATNIPVRSPGWRVKGKARKAAKADIEDAGVDLTRKERKELFQDAFDQHQREILNTKKLRPSGVKSYGPFRTARQYSDAIMNQLLKEANAGAPNLIDDSALKQLMRDLQLQEETGFLGSAKRTGNSLLPIGSRMANMAGGLGSGIAGSIAGEMAQSGGSLYDATENIANRVAAGDLSMLPMLLTGSKSVSKRINPGVRGVVGKSSVPHNAMRSLAAAERMNQLTDLDNTSFTDALNNVLMHESEEE